MSSLATYEAQAEQILLDEGHDAPPDALIQELAAELRDEARAEGERLSLRWVL